MDSDENTAKRVCPLSKEDADDVRNRLWMFLVHFASELALTGLGMKNPPFSFLALASPYAAVSNEALASHKLQWDAFEKLEKVAKDDLAARDLCEHLWNAARRGASSGGTGRFGHDKLYHHISLGSNTLTEFGRESVRVDSAARMDAPEKLPADCYTRKPGDCSLTPEDERHMESVQPDWPTPSGASWKKAQLSWRSLAVAQGNWQRLRFF